MSSEQFTRNEFLEQAHGAAAIAADVDAARQDHERRVAEGHIVVSRVLTARGEDPVPALWERKPGE